MKKPAVAVIGAGSWGTAVANVFADNGASPVIWGRSQEILTSINQKHRNPNYCPDCELNPALKGDGDLAKVLDEADLVVCSIPTQQIRSVFSAHASRLAGKAVVNTSKGIEQKTLYRVSEIFAEIAPEARYLILSGPSFALEVLQRQPTAITAASQDAELATEVQRLFSNKYLRTYTSTDVVGAELGGALKNVVAIATGIASGIGFGYNAQAAIINRGVAEIIRMGQSLGATPATFFGLSGMGDLILTCTGNLSRNRRLGVGLGEGKSFDKITKELGGVAEGAYTTTSAYELAKSKAVDMPITEQIYKILYENRPVQKAISELMGRDLTVEWDETLA